MEKFVEEQVLYTTITDYTTVAYTMWLVEDGQKTWSGGDLFTVVLLSLSTSSQLTSRTSTSVATYDKKVWVDIHYLQMKAPVQNFQAMIRKWLKNIKADKMVVKDNESYR